MRQITEQAYDAAAAEVARIWSRLATASGISRDDGTRATVRAPPRA